MYDIIFSVAEGMKVEAKACIYGKYRFFSITEGLGFRNESSGYRNKDSGYRKSGML